MPSDIPPPFSGETRGSFLHSYFLLLNWYKNINSHVSAGYYTWPCEPHFSGFEKAGGVDRIGKRPDKKRPFFARAMHFSEKTFQDFKVLYSIKPWHGNCLDLREKGVITEFTPTHPGLRRW